MFRVDRRQQCEKCGSIYFQEALFREYHTGYGSIPGEELYPAPYGAALPVRVCLCGHPTPRKTNIGDREQQKNFDESVKAALEFRSACEPEALKGRLAREYASQAELGEVEIALEKLKAVIADREKVLEAKLASESVQKPEERSAAGARAGKRKKRPSAAQPRRKGRR